MGIPGLLSEVSGKYLRYRPAQAFEGGVFHVDGLNLMSNVLDAVKPYGRTGILRDYERRLNVITLSLLQYKPKSVTVYFDACLPSQKVSVRASRRRQKLKRLKTFRQAVLPSDLMALYLCTNHPEIKIVYTGMEAEDEIMQRIYEQRQTKKRHFIFSSDSDLFTFQVPFAHAIDIVPIVGHILRRKGAYSINLGYVQRSGIVPKMYHKQLPLERTGTTIEADRPMRAVMELVNVARATGRFTANTTLVYNPANIDPFDIGIELRRCAYGATIERFFPGEHPIVYEETQEGPQLVTKELDPVLGPHLELATRAICETPLSSILGVELMQLRDKYEITDVEVVAVVKYVEELSHGVPIMISETLHERIPVLYPLLMAFLVSMEEFCMANGGQPVSRGLLWKTSPFELSSYL